MVGLPEFLKLVKRNFPETFFTHGHCHDLAAALYELFDGQLWVAFADGVYDHTVLETHADVWDIDGPDAIYRWTDMNSEFRVKFTRWDKYSLERLAAYVPLNREVIDHIKHLYERHKTNV